MKKREEKASRRTRKKLLICLRMCAQEASVRNRKQEAERASQIKPGVPRKQVQRSRRENKARTHAAPKTAPLSPL